MEKLLEKIIVKSINGKYHIYLYRDKNPLPKIKMYRVTNDAEEPINNVYQELIKLNDEFSFHIDYEARHRSTKLNTREFGNQFIKLVKESISDVEE